MCAAVPLWLAQPLMGLDILLIMSLCKTGAVETDSQMRLARELCAYNAPERNSGSNLV